MHNPSRWVVLQIYNPDTDSNFYKLMVGYNGGYLDSESWRINSGITRVEEIDGLYRFHGVSGSTYDVIPATEGTTGEMVRILEFYKQRYPENAIMVLPFSEVRERFMG